MGVPIHSKIRRVFKRFISLFLLFFFKKRFNNKKIEPKTINRIILIRVNYRIGNILFLTPLIRALERKLPHAKVDVFVGASFIKPILQNMPNVGNVYDFPRKLLKNPIKAFRYINDINKNSYDLIISPNTNSASSNIITLLLKSPIKLGFYSEDNFIATNRFVLEDKTTVKHEALKPLELMNIFKGEKLKYNKFLDIALSDIEKNEGEQELKKLFDKYNINYKGKKIIAIFKDARFEKKLHKSWWIEFVKNLKSLNNNLIIIDILSPDENKSIKETLPISSNNLRDLAKIIANLDIFISCDTGPMHLASASLTTVIAFFNITNPVLYGPLGKNDKTIFINNKNIFEIAKEVINYICAVK